MQLARVRGLRGYSAAQQAAINQYGYLPVGWSGAPISMPVTAPKTVAAPSAQVSPISAPATIVRTTSGQAAPAAPAFLGPFTGGGIPGGFDASGMSVSQSALIAAQKKAATPSGFSIAGLLAVAAAVLASQAG